MIDISLKRHINNFNNSKKFLMPMKKHVALGLWATFIWVGLTSSAIALLYKDLSTLELKQRMDDADDRGYIILDIRDPLEYRQGHIPQAVNIPLQELGYRFYRLDRSKDIIVYCNIGVQSKIACQVLANAGFRDIYNLTGGLKEWGYPLVTSTGRADI